ncbi:hypothetical protein [Rhodopila sp.]|uniref:hypothetical protein n=1 Tax=Rhodopila sp. TaxID=2480087 RepID=UPI003D101CB6
MRNPTSVDIARFIRDASEGETANKSGRSGCRQSLCDFGRDKTIFDPGHYVPPVGGWILAAGLERVRRTLSGTGDCDRQMVQNPHHCAE